MLKCSSLVLQSQDLGALCTLMPPASKIGMPLLFSPTERPLSSVIHKAKMIALIIVTKGFTRLCEFDTSEVCVTATDECSWMLFGMK